MLPSGLRVEVVDSRDGLIELRSDWMSLELSSQVELPFQTWEWAVAWWTHLRSDSAGVRDQLRVCIIRDAWGTPLAIAPLMLTERPATGPIRARYLQFIGPDPNITEIRTMVCLPQLENLCHATLDLYLSTAAFDWHWMKWERPQVREASVAARDKQSREVSAYILALPKSWELLKAGMRRNLKESLRKCYNSFRRDGLVACLEVVEDPARIEDALAEFYRLHTARAALTGVPYHPNVFAASEARGFLSDLCQRLAHRGAVRIFRLWISGRVVATRIGFELSGTLYLYYSGWDPEFARYSVMTTLAAEIVRDAIRRGLRSIHLSTGTDVSKTRWSPRERRYTRTVQTAPRASARAMYLAHAAVARLHASQLGRIATPELLRRHPAALRSEFSAGRQARAPESTTPAG